MYEITILDAVPPSQRCIHLAAEVFSVVISCGAGCEQLIYMGHFTMCTSMSFCLQICIVSYHTVPGKHPRALTAQAPKVREGGYTEKELIWFNYPHARVQPGCEVSCQGVPKWLASSLRPCFVEASLTVEIAVSCYKADWLVASLLNFCSAWSSLAVHKFCAAGEEH